MEEARNSELEAGRSEDHQHDQRSQGLQRQVPPQGAGGNLFICLIVKNSRELKMNFVLFFTS